MISFAVYAVNFTIEKSPLIDVESKTISACIFSTLESTIVDMILPLINNWPY